MSEILPHREYIAKFLAQQEPLMGKIDSFLTNDGKDIDLSNMTDEEAKIVAEHFMVLGGLTLTGKLDK